MIILIDTREQRPFSFSTQPETSTAPGTLPIGDYSLSGLQTSISVERKSLPDLVGCLTHDRSRFENELLRARGLEYFAVVVEASFSDLAGGRYRSKLNPYSAVQSVTAFETRYRVPFFFAGSRELAEYKVWSILHQFLRIQEHKVSTIMRCLEAGQHGRPRVADATSSVDCVTK